MNPGAWHCGMWLCDGLGGCCLSPNPRCDPVRVCCPTSCWAAKRLPGEAGCWVLVALAQGMGLLKMESELRSPPCPPAFFRSSFSSRFLPAAHPLAVPSPAALPEPFPAPRPPLGFLVTKLSPDVDVTSEFPVGSDPPAPGRARLQTVKLQEGACERHKGTRHRAAANERANAPGLPPPSRLTAVPGQG